MVLIPTPLAVIVAVILLASGVSVTTFAAIQLVRRKLRSFARPQRVRALERSLGLTREEARNKRVVGFFHPYCNAGGGGERVLWTALAAMQRDHGSDTVFVVYSGDVGAGEGKASKDEILAKVQARFGISLAPASLLFVPLSYRWLVEDSTWSRFTLLGQSLGSVLLVLEALAGLEGVVPDVFIDTMGYAFAYPLVKWMYDIPVGSYTHYPTISTDMLARVRFRQAGHTNRSSVASSALLSRAKLAYYERFARAYAWSLGKADSVMANSTWTRRHLEGLLGVAERADGPETVLGDAAGDIGVRRRKGGAAEKPQPIHAASATASAPTRCVRTVYPPCDTDHLSAFPLSTASRIPSSSSPITIFSLAQFRPEKEHATQLRAFAALVSPSPPGPALLPPSIDPSRLRLVLAGSVRNASDSARVESLRALAQELKVDAQTEFVVNAPFDEICAWMERASVGLHTMVDEHFGITVVEFQAAGLIPLAHASAGPLLDILVPTPSGTPTGFLAPSPSFSSSGSQEAEPLHLSFARSLAHILALPAAEQDAIRSAARESAKERFAVSAFERGWNEGVQGLLAAASVSE
ncbi:hypothetical protein Rhopal_005894-T1 [Rhodotorula paludigena]|uniref:GDP-Man:Man(3)GlcNAc(2)-PP-Dol alpha-1,2-mannosyltransferase n=1 Tax=Rhodotorula paludigena TaxID=86838 RepID=A0AAV5GUF1_9BASI|nr:hypothetical protein Rhopal_005894-T1 [Rhodotorula paludigena]